MEELHTKIEAEPVLITKIKQIIAESPQKLQDEFDRSNNVWVDCFNTRFILVGRYLDLFKESAEYTPQNYAVVESNFQKLTETFKPIHKQYRSREMDPSPEVKDDLFKLLNIFE